MTYGHEIVAFCYRFPFLEPTGVILGGNMYIVYIIAIFVKLKFAFKAFLG